MRRILLLGLSYLAITLLPVSVSSADIVIDDFSAGGFFLQQGVGTRTQVINDASILGGTRTDSLTVVDVQGATFGIIDFAGSLGLSQSGSDVRTRSRAR